MVLLMSNTPAVSRGSSGSGGRSKRHGNPTDEIVERAYTEIRTRILHEEYYPGQRLSENKLARKYSLSRTPVRQLLQRLENDGLVVVKPKSGTYVQQEASHHFIDLLQVRSYLESLAFRLAIERATDEQLGQAAKLKAAMDIELAGSELDAKRLGELHLEFHQCIVDLSGNEVLISSYKRLNLRASQMFREVNDRTGLSHTQEEHSKIVGYLLRRDAKGERFMKKHLWRRLEFLNISQEPSK